MNHKEEDCYFKKIQVHSVKEGEASKDWALEEHEANLTKATWATIFYKDNKPTSKAINLKTKSQIQIQIQYP